MEGKYIVFKHEEFFEMMGELGLPPFSDGKGPEVGGELDCAVLTQQILKRVEEVRLQDAVVIRRQDVFAPPALDAYANSIAVALTLDPEAPSTDWGQRLRAISDYFHEQAALAWQQHRKIPD